MFCPRCGAQIPDMAKFCGNCQAQIPAKSSKRAASAPVAHDPALTGGQESVNDGTLTYRDFLWVLVAALVLVIGVSGLKAFNLLGSEDGGSIQVITETVANADETNDGDEGDETAEEEEAADGEETAEKA